MSPLETLIVFVTRTIERLAVLIGAGSLLFCGLKILFYEISRWKPPTASVSLSSGAAGAGEGAERADKKPEEGRAEGAAGAVEGAAASLAASAYSLSLSGLTQGALIVLAGLVPLTFVAMNNVKMQFGTGEPPRESAGEPASKTTPVAQGLVPTVVPVVIPIQIQPQLAASAPLLAPLAGVASVEPRKVDPRDLALPPKSPAPVAKSEDHGPAKPLSVTRVEYSSSVKTFEEFSTSLNQCQVVLTSDMAPSEKVLLAIRGLVDRHLRLAYISRQAAESDDLASILPLLNEAMTQRKARLWDLFLAHSKLLADDFKQKFIETAAKPDLAACYKKIGDFLDQLGAIKYADLTRMDEKAKERVLNLRLKEAMELSTALIALSENPKP